MEEGNVYKWKNVFSALNDLLLAGKGENEPLVTATVVAALESRAENLKTLPRQSSDRKTIVSPEVGQKTSRALA